MRVARLLGGLLNTAAILYFCSVSVLSIVFLGNYTWLPSAVQPFFLPGIDDERRYTCGLWKEHTDNPMTLSCLIPNACYLILFMMQHSVMARRLFKESVFYGPRYERSIYVLTATAVWHVVISRWRACTVPFLWNLEQPDEDGSTLARCAWYVLAGGPIIGNVLIGIAAQSLDGADLLGWRRSWSVTGQFRSTKPFSADGFYAYVRHPLMMGFFVTLWVTPSMTAGRFLFAAAITVWVVCAVAFLEEPDLVEALGQEYTQYQQSVPMFCPMRSLNKPSATEVPLKKAA